MAIAGLLFMFLPGSPEAPRPLLNAVAVPFSSTNARILKERLAPETQESLKGKSIPMKLVWDTVTYWRRWPHFISTFAVFSTWCGLMTYSPSIIL
jgi:hypothetical protein